MLTDEARNTNVAHDDEDHRQSEKKHAGIGYDPGPARHRGLPPMSRSAPCLSPLGCLELLRVVICQPAEPVGKTA